VADVVITPHFDLPFQIGKNRHAMVVQQDVLKDVENCVRAALLTRRGTRFYVPTFGIDDPTFEIVPIDIATIEHQVAENEPRAHMLLEQLWDMINYLVQVQVGVDVDEQL
jgi:phage baseplate assembly protein W